MHEISPIKKSILKYVDYQNISKYKFYQESGTTRGVLDKSSGITEENIAKFIAYAEYLNIDCLITGNGEMQKILTKKMLVKMLENEMCKIY